MVSTLDAAKRALVTVIWGWLRKELRRRDLADLRAGRPVMTKAAFKARVRAIARSKRAQHIAGNFARDFKKVCKLVVHKKGAASGK